MNINPPVLLLQGGTSDLDIIRVMMGCVNNEKSLLEKRDLGRMIAHKRFDRIISINQA